MASEESAVTTIMNLAGEAKLTREGVKAPGYAVVSICKSLVAGGVVGGVSRTAVAPLERLKILLQIITYNCKCSYLCQCNTTEVIMLCSILFINSGICVSVERKQVLGIYGNLRVYGDYSEAMVLTAHGLSPIRQSSFLVMNKHQDCCS
ncbi:Mitochondrial substrate carrier family protein [Musa troglodytarum]|uniref:Mitochondrial substrate carrier family protein n=1 Tax=Musa troglodytarum TaxID=320322 RepID=A0A9E7HBK7_9LILI|nr:Mitochondrial substrate carrier family protein [Musa troglodytarum]